MGYVTCGMHGGRGPRCCWRCDACPTCDDCGPLLRGDYCRACTAKMRAEGLVWDARRKDYVNPREMAEAAGQTSLEGVTP